MRITRFLPAGIALLVPVAAAAQGFIEGTIDTVGGALPSFAAGGTCGGNAGCGFVDIVEGVVDRFRPLLTIVAVLIIVIAGYKMIVAQEDDSIAKTRAVMTSTIAGLIMAYLIDPFIHAFYGTSGEVPRGDMITGAQIVNTEIGGVINWALTIVAALSILMIVISAVKSFGQATSDEAVGNMRKTIFSVCFGLLLLVFRIILSGGFVETTGNPQPILQTFLVPLSIAMGFLALAAVIVVVYAGFQCVLSFGKEENYTKAKSLLLRAALGAIIILVSLALVNFVILPGVQ